MARGTGGGAVDGAGDEDTVLTTLRERAFFGEMALINPRGVAVASVRANGFAECYHLSSADYATLLERFPDFKSYIEGIVKLRIANYNAKSGEAGVGTIGTDGTSLRKPRSRDELIRRTEAASAADVLAAYAEGEKEIMNLSLSPDEGQRRSVAGFYDMEA